MKTLARGLSVLLCAIATACTCPQAKLPASDATPPMLTWIVTNNVSKAVQNLSGNTTLSVKWGDNYSVKMVVDDPGGVHKISLATIVEHWCGGTHVGPGLASPDETTQSPDSNNMVCTELYKLSDLDFRLGCPGGGTFTSGKADLMASGENFFNGVTTATLTFNIVP